MLSPLVRQITISLRTNPDRWTRVGRSLRRDDGVELQVLNPYQRGLISPRLTAPREVTFGLVEGYVVKRAIRAWMHRPV